MSNTLPPYPSSNDWKAWALQLVGFLQDRAQYDAENLARPVALSYLVGTEKLFQDGILMYDASLGMPVYSLGGAWTQFGGGGGGPTDHGSLTGLLDDDHPQYLTDARGDTRYVNIAGDTMTGDLTLPQKPLNDLHATTKNYVGVSQHDDTATYVFDDLVGFEGTVYHCIVPHSALPFDLVNWRPIAGVTQSGVVFEYRWTTVTSGAPPDGRFGITVAIDNPTNIVRVSNDTRNGIDVTIFWNSLQDGDFIGFVEDTGGAESVVFQVAGAVIDQGTYHTIEVNWVANTGEPENNRVGKVFLVENPANRLPDGGTTDQYLRKVSGDNYDTEWRTLVEADVTNLDRVRWRFPYVFGATYLGNDMTPDGDWLMVANKTTTDRAAPQQDNDEISDMPEAPAWVTPQFTGLVEVAREWTTSEPVTLLHYEIWVPAVGPNITHAVTVWTYPAGYPDSIAYEDVAVPTLVPDSWNTVASTRSLITTGAVFGVLLKTLDSSASTTITGDWERASNSNNINNDPGAGAWGTRGNERALRINYTDDNAADRTADVQSMVPGTVVVFEDATDPNTSMTWTIDGAGSDNGTYMAFGDVSYNGGGQNGTPNVGAATIMRAVVPTPAATGYVEIVGGNPTHTWGTSVGLSRLDGVDQPAAADAFGIRVLVDTWTVSPDWDIANLVGTSSAGGSGSGSGVNAFEDLIDTPASYVGEAGKALEVNITEDGIEFVTPSAGVTEHGLLSGLLDDDHPQYHNDTRGDARYVNIAGDTMTGVLTLAENNPTLVFPRSGSTWDMRHHSGSQSLRFTYDGLVAARTDIIGTAVPNTTTIITREKGDARYMLAAPVVVTFTDTLTKGLQTIAHGVTNPIRIEAYLVCVVDDDDYVAGDRFIMPSFMHRDFSTRDNFNANVSFNATEVKLWLAWFSTTGTSGFFALVGADGLANTALVATSWQLEVLVW